MLIALPPEEACRKDDDVARNQPLSLGLMQWSSSMLSLRLDDLLKQASGTHACIGRLSHVAGRPGQAMRMRTKSFPSVVIAEFSGSISSLSSSARIGAVLRWTNSQDW